jgi:hypothetical protein
MSPELKGKGYPVCPSCGSTDFKVDGYVGHVQPYDAKLSEYGVSEMMWDDDIPTGARCAGCDRDVTALFKKFEILRFYKVDLKER